MFILSLIILSCSYFPLYGLFVFMNIKSIFHMKLFSDLFYSFILIMLCVLVPMIFLAITSYVLVISQIRGYASNSVINLSEKMAVVHGFTNVLIASRISNSLFFMIPFVLFFDLIFTRIKYMDKYIKINYIDKIMISMQTKKTTHLFIVKSLFLDLVSIMTYDIIADADYVVYIVLFYSGILCNSKSVAVEKLVYNSDLSSPKLFAYLISELLVYFVAGRLVWVFASKINKN